MPDAAHRLKISDIKDVKVVEFVESKILDEENITEIGNQLRALVDVRDRQKLMLDFTNVDHLSSAALGMLIDVNKRVKDQSSQMRLVNIKPAIMEVFVITNLNKLLKIMTNRAEALASYT